MEGHPFLIPSRTRKEEKGKEGIVSSATLTMVSTASSSSRSKKIKIKHGDDDETKDLISELPDSILQRILSFLPMEDVIKTRVLSKRWLSVWAQVPTLNFRRRGLSKRKAPIDEHDEFVGFVSKTLGHYSRSEKVEKLLISFIYGEHNSRAVDEWIRFATQHKVEELRLDFSHPYNTYDGYHLPESIYSNSSFRILDFMRCNISPKHYCRSIISWTSLKALSIGSTYLYNDVIRDILSGCPNLEFLKLHGCFGEDAFSKLITLTSSSLREIVVHKAIGCVGSVMEISAPNVRSLSLSGCMKQRKFKLINDPSSIVEANLSFEYDFAAETGADDYQISRNFLRQLLTQFQHVQKLGIGNWCLQVLSLKKMQSLPSPLFQCKTLILNTDIKAWTLPGIANLLNRSPYVEKLIINTTPFEDSILHFNSSCIDIDVEIDDGDKYWASTERNFMCLSTHLKSVEISFKFLPHHHKFVNGFNPIKHGRLKLFCSLVEFLLKNAKVLEKMAIFLIFEKPRVLLLQKEMIVWDSSELNQLILSYPRASPTAVVQFKISIGT